MPWEPPADARTVPGAYVTEGHGLYEILGKDSLCYVLENCRTGFKLKVAGVVLLSGYRLVKPSPSVPDGVEAIAQPQR